MLAKIIGIESKEKYYQVTLEVPVTQLEPSGKIEAKVWNSDTHLIQKLKLNSEIEGIISTNKFGKVINEITIIKEGRLGLSEDEQETHLKYIYQTLTEISALYKDIDELLWKQSACMWALLKEYEEVFKTAPAAKVHHHSYVGGLLQHTSEVLQELELKTDLAKLGAILHDFAKIGEYKIDAETGVIEYNESFRDSLGLTKDSKIYPHILWAYNWCIERGFKELAHIVGSHHGTVEHGAMFKPNTPEAHLLYIADYKSAHLGALTVTDLPEEANAR